LNANEKERTMSDVHGPSWDNSTEYPSLDGQALQEDLARVVRLTADVKRLGRELAGGSGEGLAAAREASAVLFEALPLLSNAGVYAAAVLSVDGKNDAAKALVARVQKMRADLAQAYKPVHLFLLLADDGTVEAYLADPERAPERFQVLYGRTLRDTLLSREEEEILLALEVNGCTAWGNLYGNLSGEISCTVPLPGGDETMGLARAAALAEDPDPAVRRAGYEAVHAGWKTHETSCAAALNALAGWRHTVCEKRSHTRPVDFLDRPLFDACIRRETLESLLQAVGECAETSRQVLRLQARALGLEQLGPWDLFAPPPAGERPAEKIPFKRGVEMIREAFGQVHPEMADFVSLMADRRWIEGGVGETRRPGAYCTQFMKSRAPRVYMTYQGGMKDVITLAHELGHAFHAWVMRDMPLAEIRYPMTLAETASVFAEAVVYDFLLGRAETPEERFHVLWDAARELPSFLLNIPARFEFEKSFYEARSGKVLSPSEITDLNTAAWRNWYGDALSDMDTLFWASKQHFYISGISFYNFPYTFGYLFSLGVYARRETLGDGFYSAYTELLRDTGRMTAEEAARRHLDADLAAPDFWRACIAMATRYADAFEQAVAARDPG